MNSWPAVYQQHVLALTRKLWSERTFSDLEVHVGGAVFLSHRYVLGSSSQLLLSELSGRPTDSPLVEVTEPWHQTCKPADDCEGSGHVHDAVDSCSVKDCESVSSLDGGADDDELNTDGRSSGSKKVGKIPSQEAKTRHHSSACDVSCRKGHSRTILKLNNIQAETFAVVLDALYTGDDPVTKTNAVELLKIASKLQIPSLIEHCESSIAILLQQKELAPSLLLQVSEVSTSHPHLARQALEVMAKDFAGESSLNWLVHVHGSTLLGLLDDENLNAAEEDDAYDALSRWYQHDPQNRARYLGQAFGKLRLVNLNRRTLLDKVLTYCHSVGARLEDSTRDALLLQVQRALAYHLLPDRRHDEILRIADFRRSQSSERVLLVMGDHADKLFAFSFRRQTWYTLSPPPLPFGLGVAACCYDDDLYCSGGEKTPSAFFRYRPRTDSWKKFPDLRAARRNHACAAVGDAIFVLGGKNDRLSLTKDTLTSVEMFLVNDRNKGWTLLSHTALPVPVRSAAVAVIGSKIYLLGGRTTGLSVTVAAVQCFDASTLQCSLLTHLPSPSCLARTFVCNTFVYVLETNGDVFSFRPDDSSTDGGNAVSESMGTLSVTDMQEQTSQDWPEQTIASGEKTVVTKVGRVKNLNWKWYGAALHYDGTLYVVAGELPRGVTVPMVTAESADEDVFRETRFVRPRQMGMCHVTAHVSIPREWLLQNVS